MIPLIEHTQNWLWFLAPIFLYAEIHHRIAGIFSRYFRREPEIIADAPHRLEPGKKLPVFLCIKDAHRFPVELLRIRVQLAENGKQALLLDKDFCAAPINDSLWTELFYCTIPSEFSGLVNINVLVDYTIRGKMKSCINDNYALTSHAPFEVFLDPHPRPRGAGWRFGDMHTHSHLTSDQVEFGAPFDVTAAMARAMALDFFATADHSYDLDDRPDSYLNNDANLPKWKLMWERIDRFNEINRDFIIIPGEELSAGNSKNQNVHFLIFNNRHFFAGSGDGAEHWPRTAPQHRLDEALPQLEKKALAFAAHPLINPPFLQRLLLRRGKWDRADYELPHLHGVQMWNGDKVHFLEHGLPKWIELLLEGRRLTLIAGTDAHGNFNRFRQIGLPHFTMREETREILGTALTGVYVEGEFNLTSLLDALCEGRAIVTDGPFASITFRHQNGTARIGDTVVQKKGTLRIEAQSSPSFGGMRNLLLVTGDVIAKKETQRAIDMPLGSSSFTKNIELADLPRPGYIRLELRTESAPPFHCFTNPIYLI